MRSQILQVLKLRNQSSLFSVKQTKPSNRMMISSMVTVTLLTSAILQAQTDEDSGSPTASPRKTLSLSGNRTNRPNSPNTVDVIVRCGDTLRAETAVTRQTRTTLSGSEGQRSSNQTQILNTSDNLNYAAMYAKTRGIQFTPKNQERNLRGKLGALLIEAGVTPMKEPAPAPPSQVVEPQLEAGPTNLNTPESRPPLSEKDQKNLDKLVDAMKAHWMLQDLKTAMDNAQKVMALDPHHTLAHKVAVEYYIEATNYEKATEYNDSLIRETNSNSKEYLDLLVTKGRILLASGEYSSAIKLSREIAVLDSNESFKLKLNANLGLKYYRDVLDDLAQLTESEEVRPENLAFKVEAQLGLTQIREAYETAQFLFAKYPTEAIANVTLLKTIVAKGLQLNSFISKAKKNAESKPQSKNTLWVMFQIEMALGHPVVAQNILLGIIKADPRRNIPAISALFKYFPQVAQSRLAETPEFVAYKESRGLLLIAQALAISEVIPKEVHVLNLISEYRP